MEPTVLTPEEIQSIQELNNRQNSLINSLGQLEYQITLLENQKQNLKSRIEVIENENLQLGKTLNEKYGDININLETGEFTKP